MEDEDDDNGDNDDEINTALEPRNADNASHLATAGASQPSRRHARDSIAKIRRRRQEILRRVPGSISTSGSETDVSSQEGDAVDRGAADDVVQPPHLAAAMESQHPDLMQHDGSSEMEHDLVGTDMFDRDNMFDHAGKQSAASKAPSALSSVSSAHRRKKLLDVHVRFAQGVRVVEPDGGAELQFPGQAQIGTAEEPKLHFDEDDQGSNADGSDQAQEEAMAEQIRSNPASGKFDDQSMPRMS